MQTKQRIALLAITLVAATVPVAPAGAAAACGGLSVTTYWMADPEATYSRDAPATTS